MPNFCSNYLLISGSEKDVDELVEFVKDPYHDELDFDFNQIVPLPYIPEIAKNNLINTMVLILGKDEELAQRAGKLSERATEAGSSGGFHWAVAKDPELTADCAALAEELYQQSRKVELKGKLSKKDEEDVSLFLQSQGLSREETSRGLKAFDALMKSGAFFDGDINEVTKPLWGGRGPLGGGSSLFERKDKGKVSTVEYNPATAWEPALPAIRVLAQKFPKLQIDYAFTIEGEYRIGIYQFKKGKEKCLFDKEDWFDDMDGAAEAVKNSPFSFEPRGGMGVGISKADAEALKAGKTFSHPHFLGGRSMGTGKDADIQLAEAPEEDGEVECSYRGLDFEIYFEISD